MARKKSKADKELVRGSVPHIKGVVKRNIPWGVVTFVAILILVVGILTAVLAPKYFHNKELDSFSPAMYDPDPSERIPGVVKVYYPYLSHVHKNQRVAYDKNPPFGGPNDFAWATCMGNIYDIPIRNENAVRSLSNGAVWITYNPKKLTKEQVNILAKKVKDQPYLFMSPYPGLDQPISIQSWGHQLKLSDPNDNRINHFITALKQNSNFKIYAGHEAESSYPSVGSPCTVTKGFDPNHPNPLVTTPLPADAIGMDGRVVKKK